MRLYGDIVKVDEEQRMVFGYASTEAVDGQGEVIERAAIAGALDDYMRFANIREMHQLSAVGVAKEAEVDEKGLYLAAHVVDDSAWEKVKAGVYKGFSIGGKALERAASDRKRITRVSLSEISLVDRPCNPDAVFDVWKLADTGTEEDLDKREFSAKERKEDAKNGDAEDDGSYPIENRKDLEDAIRSYGRSKDKAKTKAHIIARAKALGLTSMLPAKWGVEKAEDTADELDAVEKAEADADAAMASVMDLLERMDKQAPRSVPEGLKAGIELRKGMYGVARLGSLLAELSYAVFDAQIESEVEGDNSPVPEKLRTAFRALAEAYKSMSDEELAELTAQVETRPIALVEKLFGDPEKLQLTAQDAADLAKTVQPFIERGIITVQTPQNDELVGKVAKLEGEREGLLEKVTGLTGAVEALKKRVEELAEQPMPPKAAAGHMARAVSRAEEFGGAAPTTLSEDHVLKVLSAVQALPDEDRGRLMMKAAQSQPIPLKTAPMQHRRAYLDGR